MENQKHRFQIHCINIEVIRKVNGEKLVFLKVFALVISSKIPKYSTGLPLHRPSEDVLRKKSQFPTANVRV